MASKSLKVKANKKPKFKSRRVRRCPICGRSKGTLRHFGNMCRICVRETAWKGELNGFYLV